MTFACSERFRQYFEQKYRKDFHSDKSSSKEHILFKRSAKCTQHNALTDFGICLMMGAASPGWQIVTYWTTTVEKSDAYDGGGWAGSCEKSDWSDAVDGNCGWDEKVAEDVAEDVTLYVNRNIACCADHAGELCLHKCEADETLYKRCKCFFVGWLLAR